MKTHFPALDVMRALCAMAVLAFHALFLFRFNGSLGGPPIGWAQYGYLGVPVFFMISGFVICMSAERSKRRAFLISRASRLMPTFWLCLALTATGIALFGEGLPLTQLTANLVIFAPAFGQDYADAVYWSLVVEIVFYAIIWMLLGDGFRTRLRTFAIVWLVIAGVNLVWQLPGQVILNPIWAPYFCIGIFAFLREHAWLAVSVIMGTLMAFMQAQGFAARGTSPEVAALIALVLGAGFPFAARIPLPKTILRPAAIAGAASYPLYLLHAELGIVLSDILPLWPAVIIAVSVSIGILEPKLRRMLRSAK